MSHDELANGYLKNLFSKGGKLKGVGGEWSSMAVVFFSRCVGKR